MWLGAIHYSTTGSSVLKSLIDCLWDIEILDVLKLQCLCKHLPFRTDYKQKLCMHMYTHTHTHTPTQINKYFAFFTLAVASEQELVWANSEENQNFFTLFGKFAELQWIFNDATKCMADKVRIC